MDNQDPKFNKRTYIIQSYIDKPFLYNKRKFDIRCYMLLVNIVIFYLFRTKQWKGTGIARVTLGQVLSNFNLMISTHLYILRMMPFKITLKVTESMKMETRYHMLNFRSTWILSMQDADMI